MKRIILFNLTLCLLVGILSACYTPQNEEGDTHSSENVSEMISDGVCESQTDYESDTVSTESVENETTNEAESESESEIMSETYTESNTEIETEILAPIEDFVCFSNYRSDTRKQVNFKEYKEYAVYFELPHNSSMQSFYIQFTSSSDDNANIHIELYKTEKLGHDVNTLPDLNADDLVYSENVTSIPFKTHSVYLEDGKIEEGYYVLKVTSPDEGGEYNDNVFLGKSWTTDLADYHIKSYIDGERSRYSLYGGFVIKHDVPVSQIGELNEEPVDTKIEGEKVAKIIVLSGQSNAAGATPYSYLQNNVSAEKYQEYLNGYSNVKIIYSSAALSSGNVVIKNRSDEFVDTKLGQGYVPSYFGPELGLAEYLSETYPDETFYIIKYGVGSASLNGYFNPTDPTKNACLVALKEKINLGLELLEDEGYEPQIVAFLWMQGESDANTIYDTYPYFDLQKAMVEEIRDEYSAYAPERGIAFIDAGISNHGTWATHMLMNSLKQKYAYESRANYYVDTVKAGLVTLTEEENSDQYHYVSTSVLKLGRLFGEKVSEHID